MLTIRRSGPDLHSIARQVGNVPKSMLPYAASTALTRVAHQAANIELPAEMRKVFDNPVQYTLNSLRTVPARRDNLVARVAVKDRAGRGVPQEKFLLAETQGGARRRKRMENALRYAGVLRDNQYAMPGDGIDLDASGNVKGAEIRTILIAMKKIRAASNAARDRTGVRQRKGRRLANDLFVGRPNGGGRPEGIWRREGKRLRSLFVFTSQAPSYRQRLDFDGTVQRVALDRFRPEFVRAVSALQARGGAWT